MYKHGTERTLIWYIFYKISVNYFAITQFDPLSHELHLDMVSILFYWEII